MDTGKISRINLSQSYLSYNSAEPKEKEPEKRPNKSTEEAMAERWNTPMRLDLCMGFPLIAGKWDFPDELESPITVKSNNGDTKTTKEVNLSDKMYYEWGVTAGFDLSFYNTVTVGYELYYPLINYNVWEYGYMYNDVTNSSDRGEGTEVEYIRPLYPNGLHTGYITLSDPEKPYYIEAGYIYGNLTFVQGKEMYQARHDRKTLYRTEISGYEINAGIRSNFLAPKPFKIEAGYRQLNGSDGETGLSAFQIKLTSRLPI